MPTGGEKLKVKEELQKIMLYDAKINSKLDDLLRLKSLATKVTAAMDGEVVARTRSGDTMCDTVTKIIEMQEEINGLIDLYADRKAYFSRIIDSLRNPMQIRVLYAYYYSGKSFQRIANELGYTRRNIGYIHEDAIAAVEKIIESEKGFPGIS